MVNEHDIFTKYFSEIIRIRSSHCWELGLSSTRESGLYSGVGIVILKNILEFLGFGHADYLAMYVTVLRAVVIKLFIQNKAPAWARIYL